MSEQAVTGVRPWIFEDRDDAGNVLTLTVIPTPDGVIADAHSYRDTGYPHGGVLLDGQPLAVPEGSTLQTFALAALGVKTMAQLDQSEVTVNDVPTAPAVDQRGQA